MSKQVLWIDCAEFDNYEKTLVTALQGIANRDGANIFITTGKQSWINNLDNPKVNKSAFPDGFIEKFPTTDHVWMAELTKMYGFEFVKTSLSDAIKQFSSGVSGIVEYDDASRETVAITAAGIYDCLPVADSIKQKYSEALNNFETKINYKGMFKNNLEALEYAVANLLKATTTEFVSSYFREDENGTYQNDFAVMKKAFCYNLNHVTKDNLEHVGSDEAKSYNPEEEKLLLPVLDHVDDFGFMWGWGRGGENGIASVTAARGIVLICANMPNGSFFAGITPKSDVLKQNHIKSEEIKVENKMYIAFMVNEGDTYKSAAALWNSASWKQKAAHKKLKINWGIDGIVFKLFPSLGDYYYNNAANSDYFFSATTAYGYIHPSFLRKDLIWSFAEKAKEIMEFSDTKYLDPWWFTVNDENGNDVKWDWVKAMGAEGITQWNNWNMTTFEPGFPVIRSELYYPFQKAQGSTVKDKAQNIANTLKNAREKQPQNTPYCTVVYGGEPEGFKYIMEALPKDGFEAVRLDELFAIAEKSKAQLEGIKADYDLKGNVGNWDPTNDKGE